MIQNEGWTSVHNFKRIRNVKAYKMIKKDNIDLIVELIGGAEGPAKKLVFNDLNAIIEPVRDRYFYLLQKPNYLNDVLDHGSSKVTPIAKELLEKVRDLVGIKKIS